MTSPPIPLSASGERERGGEVPHQPRVAVILSQRLADLGAGLDLAALQRWLQGALPGVLAYVVPDLAGRLAEMSRLVAASGAARVVLGLAGGEYAASEVQVQARKAGLDPLGVEVVNLGAHATVPYPQPTGTERAKLLLAAAVAKTRAFPGTRPEHVKASLSVAVSRRALFTLAVHEYRAVPAVRTERCVADRGCRRCLEACPQDAIRLKDRQIELDKARCESCGVCVRVCPTEAVEFPGHSFAELDAQIAALLDPALAELAPRGVLFVCQRSAAALEASVARGLSYPAGWLPVAVPCAGMLSPALLLRSLALGAAGVGIAGCQDECSFRQGSVVAERVAFCQDLLRQMGGRPERVRLCPVASGAPEAWALPDVAGEPPAATLNGTAPCSPRAAADALLHLAQTYGAPADLTLVHAQSPYGVIELDAQGCTGCEACTTVCPTGALASEREDGSVSVSFDTALCTACGLCVPRCPEVERGVLRLERAVDLRRLAAGRVVLYRDQTARCAACGAPIASGAMMARIAEMLGDQYGPLAATIARYCSDCRGVPSMLRRSGNEE